MVIVKLIGGLGNQLFQYAAGRRLAHVRGRELKLDMSGLDNPDYRAVRRYELAPFNVIQTFASEEEISRLTQPPPGLLSRFFLRVTRKIECPCMSYVKERHYHFDPRILDLPDGVYLDGYWQSERYFADAAELIRKEVKVNAPLTGCNAELAREIGDHQAVSLHVRRGDYITDPITHRAHGVCDLQYYARAVAYIATRVDAPMFFVFSDDPEWVRENLKLSYPLRVVDHNGPEHGHEDMRLMSLCQHHIIANSSFSWWGAWLNPRPDKIVVAPERWFNNHSADTRDLYPAGWVRL